MVNADVWDTISTRTATFCSLCGVYVDPWQDAFDLEQDLTWLNEIRVVRTTSMLSDPFVSGVGHIDFHQEARVPLDSARRYDEQSQPQGGNGDNEEDFMVATLIFNLSREYWCYVVHDVCWEILRERVDPNARVPADTVGPHLFALLYNTPTGGTGELRPGHDYGGAAKFQRPSRFGYFNLVNASDLRYLTGDPREPLQYDEHSVWEAIQAVSAPFNLPELDFSASQSNGDASGPGSPPQDVFRSLPNELAVLIFEQLASPDLCNLRLASRHVAALSGPNVLPQEFWASRFWPGHEMGFVFAGPPLPSTPYSSPGSALSPAPTPGPGLSPGPPSPGQPVNWRELYIKAKASLAEPELFPGFRNRKRVWSVLEDMARAVRLRAANQHRDADTPYRDLAVSVPAGMALGPSVFADTVLETNAATRDLDVGCRLFEAQSVLFRREEGAREASLRLAISFIQLNGRRYVCGLHIVSSGEVVDPAKGVGVGFVNPANTETISLPPGSSLEILEVAASSSGIIGLRFHARSPRESHVYSVGDMSARDPTCGVGRLSVPDNTSCVGLAVGLDACKVISMAFIEAPAHAEFNDEDQKPCQIPNRAAEIWYPETPESPCNWAVSHPSAVAPAQPFNLCLNMDFGGPDGQLLGKLTRVSVFLGGYPAVLIGMEFDYSDGSRRAYGRRDYLIENKHHVAGVEQSFFIDGPGGEVITSVEVANSPRASEPSGSSEATGFRSVQSLTLHTNRGRSRIFRLYGDGIGPPLDCANPVTIASPDGEVFVAFVAKIKSPGNFFYAFGGRSRPLADALAKLITLPALQKGAVVTQPADLHNLPLDEQNLESATDLLSHPRGFAFTATDLVNVRRVRACVGGGSVGGLQGEEGYSRSAKHISGLWIEYHDARQPKMVGQWIPRQGAEPEEDGGALDLELEPGDRITKVATWQDISNIPKYARFSPVVRVRLGTARGREKVFFGVWGPGHSSTPSSGPGSNPVMAGKICLVYRENPYEYLHGILWGCNFEWDHVRVLYAPKARAAHKLPLIPIPPAIGALNMALAKRVNFPTWMVREKAFMMEDGEEGGTPPAAAASATPTDASGVDGSGRAGTNPVIAIEVSYKDLGGEPSGLTLVYRDGGREATLGTRGKRPQRLDLFPGEALTRIEICLGRENRIAHLIFYTDASRELRFQDEAPVGTGKNRATPELAHAKAVYELTATPTTAPATATTEGKEKDDQHNKENSGGLKVSQHELLDSRTMGPFVGFWAVPKRQDRSLQYMLFGPLFEMGPGA